MEHQDATEQFSDLVEGTLSPDKEKALLEHLDGCKECQAELDSLREALDSLSGLKRLPPPQEFTSRVEKTIHRRSKGRFFGAEPFVNRVPFEWISFVVIILLLVAYLFVTLDMKNAKVTPRVGTGSGTASKKIDKKPTSQPSP